MTSVGEKLTTCRNLLKGRAELAYVADSVEDAIDRIGSLAAENLLMRDMLIEALPYVESAIDDPSYKGDRAKRLAEMMRGDE